MLPFTEREVKLSDSWEKGKMEPQEDATKDMSYSR